MQHSLFFWNFTHLLYCVTFAIKSTEVQEDISSPDENWNLCDFMRAFFGSPRELFLHLLGTATATTVHYIRRGALVYCAATISGS